MKTSNKKKDGPTHKANSIRKYPWPQMAVGDSVFIQAENGELLNKIKRSVFASAHHHGKKTGKKFTIQADQAINGVRVWRTE